MKRKALKRGFNPLQNQKNYKIELFKSSNNHSFDPDHIHPLNPENQNVNENQESLLFDLDGNELDENENGHRIYQVDKKIIFYVYKDEGVFHNLTSRTLNTATPSFRDSLTGLCNRELFVEELKRLDTDRQLPISIIMGDVNSLKLVNDVYGHEQGDRFLIDVAEILKDSCRKEDIIARWGGDEFIILLPKTNQDIAQMITKRILENCQKRKSETIPITISLGFATKNKSNDDLKEVVKQAEVEMYHQKTLHSQSVRDLLFTSLKMKFWELKRLFRKEGNTENLLNHQKIGKRLNLDQQSLNELLLLAALHDIGKIVLPLPLFLKKDPLTPNEWEMVKRIPEISYRILQYFQKTFHIANAALSYCEWWDGSGYPRQLSGESIPMISRISAVVNTYDLIIHPRPFKNPLTPKEALAEIQQHAGKQFDPVIAELYYKMKENELK